MIDDMISRVEAAIEASLHWHETGWSVTFGPRNVEVSSLKAAEALPRNAVYREEAVNYWRQVRLAGVDTSSSGKQALAALNEGRLHDADNALYLCHYLEKPFEGDAGTWIPLYEAFRIAHAA